MSFDIAKYPTLALVDSTQELRLLPKESLPKLCDELRRYLLDSVSRSSGHFASGLGTVELTVALHYVYNTPFDQLIWDVGHQAYPHKILTGRRDKIGTIRQKGGLHPFPWRGESEYDVLSVGHSSTSISAGIGIAVAAEKEGKNRRTVCVIGDGAITAGMAFEAMNHAGDIRPDMLVVLNDNEMSISENVGALNNHLAQLLSGKLYSSLREGGKKVFSGVPPIKELLKRTEEHIKGMVVPGTLFEELGFNYIGPVDGHDVLGLITTLKNMRDLKGPQFLHIMTKKGRGYEPAEKDPITFHAVPKFDPSSGCLPKSSGGLPSYSKIFGDWLCETAAKDNKLMAITPAMREGSGMVEFSRKFPDRYFDVAIAEQHAVTFAAGLAIGGYKPIVAIYSTFLQRAYDQVLHDVAIQKLPVLFAIDRAGIVGADGQTHQGAFDLSYLRCIPEMVIMTPSDENECRQMLYTGYHYNDGPSAVRYPRGGEIPMDERLGYRPGEWFHHRSGGQTLIVSYGRAFGEAYGAMELLASEGKKADLLKLHRISPIPDACVQLAKKYRAIYFVEEGVRQGGIGEHFLDALSRVRYRGRMTIGAVENPFIPAMPADSAFRRCGLDAQTVARAISVLYF